MVQVQINLTFNLAFRSVRLVPSSFSGTLALNTAMGERKSLYTFQGYGGLEEAQAAALGWVLANMLEYDNASCRPLRYQPTPEQ